jgi:glycogen(starch) synthase
MRILCWSDLFWPYIGGGEIFAAKLLMALRERHEFIVVTRQDTADLPPEDSYQGIPVYRFPFCTALAGRDMIQMLAAKRRITELKRTFAPDLVHVQNFGPSVLFLRETADVSPTPLLLTLTTEILPDTGTGPDTLMGRTLRSADWINCVSSATLAQVRQRVPRTISRSSVIFNSVEVPPILPQPLPAEMPRLLCLGRLHAEKGFDVALSALARIVERFPRLRLTIAGDGPELSTLQRQASNLNLTGVVDFMGWVSPEKIPALMNTATLVVMPSRSEGLPLVALEAALMARPIVGTRIPGLAEIVMHRQNGLLVELEDSAGLAEAITFLLTHPQVAVQMGQSIRSRVQEMFSWIRCVDAYDAIYRKLGHDASCAQA